MTTNNQQEYARLIVFKFLLALQHRSFIDRLRFCCSILFKALSEDAYVRSKEDS